MPYLADKPVYNELRLTVQCEGRRLFVVAEMPDGAMYKNYAELNVGAEEIEEALASLPRAMDAVNRSLYVDTSDAVMSIGNRLCKAVLGGRLWPLYQQLARGVESQGQRLRLRLVIDTPGLLTIPWEFMYDDTVRKDFFALSLQSPIIRANAVRDLSPSRPISGPPRVLAAISEVLPYDYAEFASTMLRYIAPVERGLTQKGWSTAAVTPLTAAITRLGQAATQFATARDAALARGVSKAQKDAANTALLSVERGFARDAGLKSRPWYRTLIYAADVDNGYSSMVFPGVNEAIRYGTQAETSAEIADLVQRFDNATAAMNRARAALETPPARR